MFFRYLFCVFCTFRFGGGRRDKKEGCPFHKDNPLFIVLFYPYLSTVYTFGVFPELFLRARKRKKVCEQEGSFAIDDGRIHLLQ